MRSLGPAGPASGTRLRDRHAAAGPARRRGRPTSYGAGVVAVGSDRDGIAGLERARAVGVPTFVQPVEAFAERSAWDDDLHEQVAEHRPDLVVCAGFMRLLGPVFLGAFGGRTLNSHPALLPSFPGMHGPRDALGVRGQDHRGYRVPRRRRGRHGRHRGSGGGAGRGRRLGRASARADQDRGAEAARRHRPPPGHHTVARHRTKGAVGQSDRIPTDRRRILRALVSVYDKTELDPDRRVARRRRGRDRLHRIDGANVGGGRVAGDAGRAGDRFPRVPGRSGEDAAPRSACRTAGRPPAGLARGAAQRAGHRAVPAVDQQPVPLHRDGGLGRLDGRNASSRSTSGVRRWCGPRPRTTRAWR